MWKLKIGEEDETLQRVATINNHIGRQIWEFDPDAGTCEERAHIENLRQQFKKNRFQQRQSSDLLMRFQLRKENPAVKIPPPIKVNESEEITEESVVNTLKGAITYFSSLQVHTGNWVSELCGGLYFLPPLIITLYISGELNAVFGPEHRKEIIRYIYNHQNEDGGWGLHIEATSSSMLSSVESYVTLRLLGEGPEDGEDRALARGRKWILDHGAAVAIPSWGKFWLSVLGAYEWEGCNPLPPEIWLLPKISYIHPGQMLALARLVYLPMSYLYGKRFVGPITDLIKSLRQELFDEPYNQINWGKARNNVAKEDLFCPHSMGLDLVWGFFYHVAEPILRRWPFSMIREKAIKSAIERVHYEDTISRYRSVASQEKIISMLACWAEDPNSEAYKCHLSRIPDYFWVAEDGGKLQGLGSQTWDTALAVQAIILGNPNEEYMPTLRKAHDFLKASQVREDPPGNFTKMYRHICKGGWTFNVADQAWVVADCTAESLTATLMLSQLPPTLVGEAMDKERFFDAVNILLYYQSPNGGFPCWEPNTAFRWLEEYFNPTEFLEDTIIEREYVECTASAIQSLILFRKIFPKHRRNEIDNSISKGLQYLEKEQNPDGSWYGRWGICYTYAARFAVEALVAGGKKYKTCDSLRKSCQFLLSKQLPDGGWGESYLSSVNKVYTNLEGNRSNLVQTSWALLALISAGQGKVNPKPINRGIRLLINSQMEDGDFPQQEPTGMYMKNCVLHYSAYRNIYPIRALAEYRQTCFA